MYVLRDKKTKDVIYIDYVDERYSSKPEEVYAKYDPVNMEMGWSDGRRLPIDFNIDNNGFIQPMCLDERIKKGLIELSDDQKFLNGEIVQKSLAELVDDGLISLLDFKRSKKEYYSDMCFKKRRDLIPDFKLENAALGVYGEDRLVSYRETVIKFRMEYKRIESLIENAETINDIEEIKPDFPNKLAEVSSY